MAKREVLLVVEESKHYYVDADSDEEALAKATEMFDRGEPEQGLGWLIIKRHEVYSLDPNDSSDND